ncbi:MAG: class II aldolase/adducin family protein [Elusimicrobiota bacterium]
MKKNQAAKEIIFYAKKLKELGFLAGFSGNISVRISEKSFLITPSSQDKSQIKISDLCETGLNGKIFSKNKPSSEWRLHAFVYENYPKAKAVIHTHPPFISVFSCSKVKINKPLLAEFEIMLKKLPKSGYFTPGSGDLAKAVKKACDSSQTVILSNHGLLTYATDLKNAFALTEEAEHFAKIYWLSEIMGRQDPIKSKHIPALKKLSENFKF